MRNIRILIEYDGTRYDGWQRLGRDSGQRTIQGKIEEVLTRMCGEEIQIIGSGRTDAGVHAYGQTANFHTNITWSCEEIYKYMNQYLPEDIGIRSVEDVEERFHSRIHAKSKIYIYRVVTGNTPCVFDRKYVCRMEEEADLLRMQQAAKRFIGTHDFRAFSSDKRTKKSTIREMYHIDIYQHDAEIRFLYHGNGFLYNMVRIMTGTLWEAGTGKIEPEDIDRILESKNRQLAGPTVPAKGLTLYRVLY